MFAVVCENVTSSTKPEVHNISHRRQRRTKPRPWVTFTENVVKSGHVVFEICERRDSHIDRNRSTTHPRMDRKNLSPLVPGGGLLTMTTGKINRNLDRMEATYGMGHNMVGQPPTRSVQPFSHRTSVWPAHIYIQKHTDTQTTLRATPVAIGRILCTLCMQCGLIIITRQS